MPRPKNIFVHHILLVDLVPAQNIYEQSKLQIIILDVILCAQIYFVVDLVPQIILRQIDFAKDFMKNRNFQFFSACFSL